MSREVPPGAQCFRDGCERRAVDPNHPAGFCDDHLPENRDAETEGSQASESNDCEPKTEWETADFADPKSGVWPGELLERVQWMGHSEKKPFAPWADRDHPEAEEDEDARWKWGLKENYVDGETIAIAEDDPRIDGRAFLQQPDDPFAYVDGDDVRDPENGDVHPDFLDILDQLGLTYADVSQSGAGVHAMYVGELPEGVKQASWQLDAEPWGSNDDLPSIEIYAGKRVCVATGEHVPGTPEEIREWDRTALTDLLDEADQLPRNPKPSDEFEDFDAEDYEPSATGADEETTEIRDVFAAIDRLDAQRVAARTIVSSWNDQASTSKGERAFHPTWGGSSNGTANIVNRDRWQDTGDRGGYGGPVCMAAIDAAHISVDERDCPHRVRGQVWFEAVDHLRDLGFEIPEYVPQEEDAEPVSMLPLQQLARLEPDERRRVAKQRGFEIPTTEDVRERVGNAIGQLVAEEGEAVVEAPTGAGKSYYASTKPWTADPDVTGGQPVILFADTREHRKQNAEKSQNADVTYRQLRGRTEACPCAGGEHDPRAVAEADEDLQAITVDGEPISSWFNRQCEGKGLPFSVAHKYAEKHNDQGLNSLPCSQGDTECLAIAQWEGLPRTDDGDPAVDVIHATHDFAHVPSLRMQTNMLFDEQPDFTVDVGEGGLTQDRIQRMVAGFLQDAGAPVETWEGFVAMTDVELGDSLDASNEAQQVQQVINTHEPNVEWYFDEQDAHTLAPSITRVLWHALRQDTDGNGFRSASAPHEPPRLDKNAKGDDGWNREWLKVVVDDQNRIRRLWDTPDLQLARSVVGLDARPVPSIWQLNVLPQIERKRVLTPDERSLWRYFEQGKTVVQVGDATRPFTSGEYFDPEGTQTVLEHLFDEHKDVPVITASSVENQHRDILQDLGVDEPKTMHFGEEKSREDFADETAMLVNGAIDPGDDFVLELLAALGKDAQPETKELDDGEEVRAHGRGFVGEDADVAEAVLESVRANHVAQAIGRSGRNPEGDERATVYVRTDVAPPDLVDFTVPGVEWAYGEKQRAIRRYLRDHPGATAAEMAEATDASKGHVRQTLEKLDDFGRVRMNEGVGDHGATIYSLVDDPGEIGVADMEITNSPVWGTYTWELAIWSELGEPDPDADRLGSKTPGRNMSIFAFGDDPPD